MPNDNVAAVRVCCFKPGAKVAPAEPDAALISSRKDPEQTTTHNNKYKQRA